MTPKFSPLTIERQAESSNVVVDADEGVDVTLDAPEARLIGDVESFTFLGPTGGGGLTGLTWSEWGRTLVVACATTNGISRSAMRRTKITI